MKYEQIPRVSSKESASHQNIVLQHARLNTVTLEQRCVRTAIHPRIQRRAFLPAWITGSDSEWVGREAGHCANACQVTWIRAQRDVPGHTNEAICGPQ